MTGMGPTWQPPARLEGLEPLPQPPGPSAEPDPRDAGEPVAIIIPMLNEAASLPRLIRSTAALHPPPAEIIAVDGGSTDGSVALAEAGGLRVIAFAGPGRPAQINHGVRQATAPLVMVLHADTILPDDAMAVVRATLADRRTALAGFTAVICGRETVRWGTTFHNWIKTWYAPLLFRPQLFLKGGRLLFGDHAMFFRRADFLAVGGCDETLTVMEDADLCLRLVRRGRVRLVNRLVMTSDRRVAACGGWRANWIYLYVGMRWGLGLRRRIERHYPDVR